MACIFALLIGAGPGFAQQPADSSSGLPIPRFVSLKADRVNIRTGPGRRYPIQYVYVRAGVPVEITAEYDQWRRVRDADGDEGWVHRSLLSGQRTAVVRNGTQTAYSKPAANDGKPVFRAQKGVYVRLLTCDGRWCRIEIQGMRGWMLQNRLWGVYGDERFD